MNKSCNMNFNLTSLRNNITDELETFLHVNNNKIRVQQHIDELKWLISKVVKIKPKIILEIGLGFRGFHKINELILQETYDGSNKNLLIGIDRDYEDFQLYDPDLDKVEIYSLKGLSQDEDIIYQTINILQNKEIDFLFIDGDHTYNLVRKDFITYSQFVRKGGLIGFHDIASGDSRVLGGPGKLFYELEGRKEKILGDLGMGTGVVYV